MRNTFHVCASVGRSIPHQNENLCIASHLAITDRPRRFTIGIPVSREPTNVDAMVCRPLVANLVDTWSATGDDLGDGRRSHGIDRRQYLFALQPKGRPMSADTEAHV